MFIRRNQVLTILGIFFLVIFYLEYQGAGKIEFYGQENHLPTQEESYQEILLRIKYLENKIDNLIKQNDQIRGQGEARGSLKEQEIVGVQVKAGSLLEAGKLEDKEKNQILLDTRQDIVNGKLRTSTGKPVRVIILLGSTARSGTSFMGELLSQTDQNLYLFEPELYIREITKEKVVQDLGIKHVRDMIYCRISDRFAGWLKTRSSASNIFRHSITKNNCKNWTICLTSPRLQEACRGEHLRIMKIIRIRMAWLRPLLEDPNLDVKVIHLVRDPRGSLYSMAKNQLHVLMPEYYCPLIDDDINSTPKMMEEYPGRVVGVSYEQMCLDPFGQALRIWRFLVGDKTAKLSPNWQQYLDKHVSIKAAQKHVAVYGTKRNTTEQYQAWRNDITEHALTEIEANCATVIKSLGYNIFGTLERARNLTYPYFISVPPY